MFARKVNMFSIESIDVFVREIFNANSECFSHISCKLRIKFLTQGMELIMTKSLLRFYVKNVNWFRIFKTTHFVSRLRKSKNNDMCKIAWLNWLKGFMFSIRHTFIHVCIALDSVLATATDVAQQENDKLVYGDGLSLLIFNWNF